MGSYLYSELKQDTLEEFNEYLNEYDNSILKATARVLEESIRCINEKQFYRDAIYVVIATESLKNNVIVKSILDEVKDMLKDGKFSYDVSDEDNATFICDIQQLKYMLENASFKVVEFDEVFMNRLRLLLNL
jgi:hypothetical protein